MPPDIRHHRIITSEAALHYVVAGNGPPLVLIHGFPQTWHQWRFVIARLADRFRIIAPDLRGIGAAPGPATGYDKQSMAADVRAIMEHEVGSEPAAVVGHDMGSYVAFAHALRYPKLTKALALIDAPMPGTTLFDQLKTHPRAWHIAFHCARDVPEMLITGRERAYIAHFVATRIYDTSAISAQDLDIYAAAYSTPGALRAGMEMYRALESDAVTNRKLLAQGKLRMPVVVVGGGTSLSGSLLGDMAAEIAENANTIIVERAGHWIPEEQPDQLAEIIAKLAG